MYKTVIADDQCLFRDFLIKLLEESGDFKVIGEACDGEEALSVITVLKPDVAIVDVQMEPVNGLEAARRIACEVPETTVIVVSTFSDGVYGRLALDAGAAGFISKRSLTAAKIKKILQNEDVCPQGNRALGIPVS